MDIHELSAETRVSVSAIRWYRKTNLLPPPSGYGRWATYGNEHLRRLRLIRDNQDQRVTLADLRVRFQDRRGHV